MASKIINRGAWTAEEDRCLAEVIQLHGPEKWKTIATKAGLDRCGKSCRLRWLNYLRPNIKRGNITDQEEDLIIRLHNLLGNRWSLIAGRLPGRTDNEIKNYWNSHLSKKLNKEGENEGTKVKRLRTEEKGDEDKQDFTNGIKDRIVDSNDDDDDNFFDFSNESPVTLEWINKFLELDNNSKDQPS